MAIVQMPQMIGGHRVMVDVEVPDDVILRDNNQRDLFQKAHNAVDNNLAYLAIPTPTQAQAVQQVERLTRQVTGIIRMMMALLDSTDGT